MQKERTEETARTSRLLAAIIANPTSGSYTHHAADLEETVAFLQDHGWNVALRLTEAAGDGRRLAREAVNQQAEVVIAAGGDGTINEVIQELAGTETALGVLPIGTVNDWAREIGIPLDVHGARDILVHGRTRHIDLGCVNEHYFLLMAGIGLDGDIAQKVEQHPLKRLGVVGYLLASIWYGLRYQSFVTSVISSERVEKASALQIVVGNTQLYGGAIKFTWQAKADDGLLDVVIVRRRGVLGRLLMAGIGLDGDIAQKVEQHPLKRLGVVGYLLASIWYGLRYQSFVTSVISSERVEKASALQIVVGNTQLYGGAIKFTWQAKADDGLLDVVIVRRRGILGRLLVAVELFLPRKKRMPWITYERSEAIEIRTPKPVTMQIDGEPIGSTPARFTSVPSALKVIVPHESREQLFSQD